MPVYGHQVLPPLGGPVAKWKRDADEQRGRFERALRETTVAQIEETIVATPLGAISRGHRFILTISPVFDNFALKRYPARSRHH
jgi:hypothetical protein